jgi:hypothetical protein
VVRKSFQQIILLDEDSEQFKLREQFTIFFLNEKTNSLDTVNYCRKALGYKNKSEDIILHQELHCFSIVGVLFTKQECGLHLKSYNSDDFPYPKGWGLTDSKMVQDIA